MACYDNGINRTKQTTIEDFYSKQKGPLKIDCPNIMSKAENERLLKLYRRNAKKHRQKVSSMNCSTSENSQPEEPRNTTNQEPCENALSPQIIFSTEYGCTEYIGNKKSMNPICESEANGVSPSKRQKSTSGDLTITRSTPQTNQINKPVSLTLQMTQSENLYQPDEQTSQNTTLLENINIEDVLEVELLEGDNLLKIRNHTKVVEDIIENTIETHLSPLIFSNEKNVLENFMELTLYQKYFSCKLFTHQVKWYNVYKFAESIHLPISQVQSKQIMETLREKSIIKTDYTCETTASLLNLLNIDDVKELHDTLRLKTKQKKKDVLIDAILKYVNNQTTLHPTISLDKKVKQMIGQKLGDLVQITPIFYTAMNKVHLLYSYGNPELDIPNGLYLRINHIKYGNISHPDFICKDELIFNNAQEFADFYKAFFYKTEVLKKLEKKGDLKFSSIFDMSKEVVKEFQEILTKMNSNVITPKANHLERFTSGYQYASALWIISKQLSSKYPLDVQKWLELLLGQKHFYQKKRGLWYSHLSMVYKAHLKENGKSIETLILGLQDKDVSDVDIGDVVYRARSYCNKKTLNTKELSNLLISWMDSIPRPELFPSIKIEALGNYASENSGRNGYRYMYPNGDVSYMGVEQIAIRHYIDKKGFTEGLHCEGALIKTLFHVLFWDLIYVPGIDFTFVCKMQTLPLDFYCEDFYKNRKEQIDRRLSEIKYDWTQEYFKSFIMETWYSISKHKSHFVLDYIKDGEKLCHFVNCIGRTIVSDICQRLVVNIRNYRAGMPDLFVYNENSCKFVEVKGPGDSLSTKQKLWINYLLSIGANVEVCYVSKIRRQ